MSTYALRKTASISYMEAAANTCRSMLNFTGQISRREFIFGLSFLASLVGAMFGFIYLISIPVANPFFMAQTITTIWALFVFVVWAAPLIVRRMRDVEISLWWFPVLMVLHPAMQIQMEAIPTNIYSLIEMIIWALIAVFLVYVSTAQGNSQS